MIKFLSQIKNYFIASKEISFWLISVGQIQIILMMLVGTSLQFFKGIEFLFQEQIGNLETLNIWAFVAHFLAVFLIMWQVFQAQRNNIKREKAKKLTAMSLICYKNFLMVPVLYLCFSTVKQSSDVKLIILAILNIICGLFLCYIKELCCVSYRFRVTCHFKKLSSTLIDSVFIVAVVIVVCFQGPEYGAIILLLKDAFRLGKIYYCFEDPLIQKLQLFYNLYQMMICTIIISSEFLMFQLHNNIVYILSVLIFGGIVVKNVTQNFSTTIYTKMISASNIWSMEAQGDTIVQNQQGMIQKHFNQIRVISLIYLQKQKYEAKQPNQFDKWWQFFNRKILIHKVNCTSPKCKCSLKGVNGSDVHTYLRDLMNEVKRLSTMFSKEMKLKIMTIYMYIQILGKPLKAYYELMRLKSQQKSGSFDIQLADLSMETRECFDQLFLKNKVKNQKLQLFKVIEFEQLVSQCQSDMKKIINETIQFYSYFNYNTVKISELKEQSNNLKALKTKFQTKITRILKDYSSNLKLTILIHFFYNYIEVYQNNQAELKKIYSHQLFKKRIFDKKELNVFSPEFGSIFIDLVEERGKIKNVTKNISTLYGYPKEDMVNFNINLFMPRLFGKHHAKFLHNFIEKGKFKLLRENLRSVFGKNKKKFIFPMKIYLKAEYLLDNFFGSSSLLQPIETFSQFVIADKYGKVQQMTEGLYKKMFLQAFHDQNQKVHRLHLNKLIPSFNNFYQNPQDLVNRYDKIMQGVFVFCGQGNYLMEKFRFVKDFSKPGKTLAGKTISQYSTTVSNKELTYTSSTDITKEEQQINLTDAIKYFLSDIELFALSGYKITYKISPLVTAQFEAELVEIISFQPFTNQHLAYQSILDELSLMLDMFQFGQDDRCMMLSHFKKLQEQINIKDFNTSPSNTSGSSQYSLKVNTLMGQDAPREVKKANRISNKKNQSISCDSHHQLEEEKQNIERVSTNNPTMDIAEGQSKKQILVTAFGSDNKTLDSKYSKIAFVGIFLLVVLLVTLLVQSVILLKLFSKQWKSTYFIEDMKRVIEYRKSLIQIEQFQALTGSVPSQFISLQMDRLNRRFKLKIQRIHQSVVEEDAFNQLYTGKFMLANSLSSQSQQVSFIELLNALLYRFSYVSSNNDEFVQNTYESIQNEFQSLQVAQEEFLQEVQTQKFLLLVILNSVYILLILILGLACLPLLIYFKQEEKTMTQLLQYISFNELKKSLNKLTAIQQQLNRLDKIQNFQHMKNQVTITMSSFNKNTQQSPHQKSPRIISENKKSSCLIYKCILAAIVLVIFLGNMPMFIMGVMNQTSSQFSESLKLSKMSFKLQNKPAQLLNVYLHNVNRVMKDQEELVFSTETEDTFSRDYFTLQTLLSSPQYEGSRISQKLQRLRNIQLCMITDECAQENSYGKTFNYLVYSFKNKFEFLSSQNKLSADKEVLTEWMGENQIKDILLFIEQVIEISEKVNYSINLQYYNQLKTNINAVIAVGVLLIVVNSIVLLLAKHLTFTYLNKILKQTEDIFRHFDIETLSENTYLTSYFNTKLKGPK